MASEMGQKAAAALEMTVPAREQGLCKAGEKSQEDPSELWLLRRVRERTAMLTSAETAVPGGPDCFCLHPQPAETLVNPESCNSGQWQGRTFSYSGPTPSTPCTHAGAQKTGYTLMTRCTSEVQMALENTSHFAGQHGVSGSPLASGHPKEQGAETWQEWGS